MINKLVIKIEYFENMQFLMIKMRSFCNNVQKRE